MTTAKETMTQAIIEAIKTVEPQANTGAMASIREVREAFEGFGFNIWLWEAVRSGAVFLHKHDHPFRLTDEERQALFSPDGKDYYNGVTIRQ